MPTNALLIDESLRLLQLEFGSRVAPSSTAATTYCYIICIGDPSDQLYSSGRSSGPVRSLSLLQVVQKSNCGHFFYDYGKR